MSAITWYSLSNLHKQFYLLKSKLFTFMFGGGGDGYYTE